MAQTARVFGFPRRIGAGIKAEARYQGVTGHIGRTCSGTRETGLTGQEESVTETGEDYKLEDQVGFLLRIAGQRHAAIFQNLAPYGLTPTQFAALVRLADMGECSQNELGRRTAMDVATVKGVADRLRAKGFVEMRPDLVDRRRAVLSVSPNHENLVETLHDAGRRISEETLKPLSASEARTLLRLLRKIGSN